MGLFDIFRRKKEEENSTEKRREFLLTKGRICDGTIIDTETTDAGEEIVYYFYQIQGVDFESSEILTDEQKKNPLKYAPGAKVGVRFDPRNHGNSILD
ncbi:MAG TPA: hypothetical protein PKE69_08250 [Pyrinomonadaceae bacterium]|nr:hypothetical protein [Pyrinomonadaceae bacterium]